MQVRPGAREVRTHALLAPRTTAPGLLLWPPSRLPGSGFILAPRSARCGGRARARVRARGGPAPARLATFEFRTRRAAALWARTRGGGPKSPSSA
eukprot:scaffold795_cov375-Prasinococcus_capsulatus_cf.AAC.25